jgi:hypothetical protein
MAKSHLKLLTPATVNRTVKPKRPTIRPKRRSNSELRTREYLTEAEGERLMNAAKGNRWGHRDATMLLVAFGTACEHPNWWTCTGIRWTLGRRRCTSAEQKKAHPALTRSLATSYAPCGG